MKPDLWVIVDDNSAIHTKRIIRQLEQEHKFAQTVLINQSRTYDEVFRYGNVVNAGFHYALARCLQSYNFLSILDVDIKISKNHYELMVKAFHKNPELGIASGLYIEPKKGVYSILGNGRKLPICGADMMFKRECLQDIGGFPTCPRPDTIALLKAINRGWKIGVVTSTYAIHLRVNESLNKYIRQGFASYFLGYHPVNAFFSGPFAALKELSLSPLGMTIGYIKGKIVLANKINDPEVLRYFNENFYRGAYKISNFLSNKNVFVDPIENSSVNL